MGPVFEIQGLSSSQSVSLLIVARAARKDIALWKGDFLTQPAGPFFVSSCVSKAPARLVRWYCWFAAPKSSDRKVVQICKPIENLKKETCHLSPLRSENTLSGIRKSER